MTSPSDDILKWTEIVELPIAGRFPVRDDHPFCTGHTHNALNCALPFGSPDLAAADKASYGPLERDFLARGMAAPPLAQLAEHIPYVDDGVLDEATNRAAQYPGHARPSALAVRVDVGRWHDNTVGPLGSLARRRRSRCLVPCQ